MIDETESEYGLVIVTDIVIAPSWTSMLLNGEAGGARFDLTSDEVVQL